MVEELNKLGKFSDWFMNKFLNLEGFMISGYFLAALCILFIVINQLLTFYISRMDYWFIRDSRINFFFTLGIVMIVISYNYFVIDYIFSFDKKINKENKKEW